MIDLSGSSLEITPALVRFKTLAGRFTDFTPVMGGRIDVAARRYIRRHFETEGRAGAGGGGWEALTANYLKRRVHPNRPILRQEDGLFDALTQRGNENQLVVMEPDLYSITVDPDSEVHARFVGHMFGIPRSNLPARPPIPEPSKTFIKEVSDIVRSYVLTGKS